jgi:hypothetical protein
MVPVTNQLLHEAQRRDRQRKAVRAFQRHVLRMRVYRAVERHERDHVCWLDHVFSLSEEMH